MLIINQNIIDLLIAYRKKQIVNLLLPTQL